MFVCFLCPDSDWDCGEDDSQDGEDMLCNTMLITGPTGVGKTAAVYACAQELGFKVQTHHILFETVHSFGGYLDSFISQILSLGV